MMKRFKLPFFEAKHIDNGEDGHRNYKCLHYMHFVQQNQQQQQVTKTYSSKSLIKSISHIVATFPHFPEPILRLPLHYPKSTVEKIAILYFPIAWLQ